MNFVSRRGIIVCLVVALVVIAAPFIGVRILTEDSLVANASIEQKIFWDLRLPRVVLAALCGAALSTGGVVFQAVFHNPLASPFTLGVASGAAFGAAMYFLTGWQWVFLGFSGASIFALCGAFLTTALILVIQSRQGTSDRVGLLLAGVVMSFFFSSLIVFIQYISDFAGVFRITRWLMGGFEVVGFGEVIPVALVVVPCLMALYFFALQLDLLILGDELGASRGLDARRARSTQFLLVSVMIGVVVSICGPIGFVGIIVPHYCRILFGPLHRGILLFSIVVGAGFMVLCDTLARTVIAPYELPAGIITALVGGPIFLNLLLRRSRRVYD